MRMFMFAALGGSVVLGVAAPSLAQVTLNASTLAAVEQPDSDHVRKVREVLRVATQEGCLSAAKALKAKLDVADARCDPGLLRTSYPPKQRLTFTLDGTPYVMFLTVRPFEIVPLR